MTNQTVGGDVRPEEELPPAAEEDIASLRERLEGEQQKAQDYLANWQRSQADFINYRRRTEQEKEDVARYATSLLMAGMLPVVDDFERAFSSIPLQMAGFSWIDGIALIYRRLLSVLEAQGLKEIDAEGKEFDPNFHQAVTFADGEDGKVAAVLQKGYLLHDRVLRPSMVAVGRAPEKEAPSEEATGAEATEEGAGAARSES